MAYQPDPRKDDYADMPVPSGTVPRLVRREDLDPPRLGLPQGRKDDAGKLDMTLLDDMPRALKAVVQVMQWAIEDKKPVPYERSSWLGVGVERYRAAAARHRRDAAEQASAPDKGQKALARFQRDKETELLHLAHETVSNLFALELTLRELENERG